MCPVRYRDVKRAFLGWDAYVSIIDQLPQLAELHLQGLGEPLLHPHFCRMVEYAAQRGVRVSVNTNLTLLNERYAQRLARCGLDTIYISVDGATPATYERIRTGARFERLQRNVTLLLATLRGLPGPRTALTAVAMRENVDELAALVELAGRWGIEALHVQHLCHDFGESTLPAQYEPMRAFVDEQTLVGYDPVRVARAFADARRAAERTGVALRLPRVTPVAHAPETPGRSRCSWPWHGPYVAYDGTAMPCCMVATPDRAALGNVVRESVATVWNGPAYEEFRRRLDSPEPPEICRSCSVYTRVF